MQPQPIVESDCTIELQGKTFTAGGAVLAPCTDGKWRGCVYVQSPYKNETTGYRGETIQYVTTWHGDKIALARLGKVYQGNFCRMQAVSFEWQGMRFTGRYCPDWSDLVRVHTTKAHPIAS